MRGSMYARRLCAKFMVRLVEQSKKGKREALSRYWLHLAVGLSFDGFAFPAGKK